MALSPVRSGTGKQGWVRVPGVAAPLHGAIRVERRWGFCHTTHLKMDLLIRGGTGGKQSQLGVSPHPV